MKSILEVLQLSTDYLNKKGIAQPRRQAEELLSDALNLKRIDLYTQFERPLSEDELTTCREKIRRRGEGEPIQYIQGNVEFYGCRIKVSPDVLIPRQETEILVDKIAKELSDLDLQGKVLWDVCCGSGYIGIALKKKFPQLQVFLSDISKPALKLAQENAEANGVEVVIKEGDFLEPFRGEKTHFLVCNPPYISQEEYSQLDKEVKNYEPKLALLGGATGLEFYKRLAADYQEFLFPEGIIWLEIGYNQGEAIKRLFSQEIVIEKDYSGHDRFAILRQKRT